jgi:hypothetical protein
MKSAWRKWRDKGQNRTKANADRRAGRRKDPRTFLFNEARSRAKIMGKAFSITLEDVVISPVCPVFGQPLTVKGEVGNWFSASLDEVVHGLDPMGYIKAIAALMPKQIEATQPLDDMGDAELLAAIALLRTRLTDNAGEGGDQAGELS